VSREKSFSCELSTAHRYPAILNSGIRTTAPMLR